MREAGNLDEAEELFLETIISTQDDTIYTPLESGISEDPFDKWKDNFVRLIFDLDELLIETSNDSNVLLRDKINIMLNRFRQIFEVGSK